MKSLPVEAAVAPEAVEEPAAAPPIPVDADRLALATSFRALAENVPGALFRYVEQPDGSSSVQYMSPGCQSLWELPPQAISEDATRLWQMVEPADLPAMVASVRASARTLQPWHHEWRITTPSGVRKWLEGRGQPQALPGGGVLWNSLVLDITARKQAELQSRVRDAALRSALDGVALAGLDTRLTWVNPAFCRMWRVQPEQAIGRLATAFWRDPDHPAAVVDALRKEGCWQGTMVASRLDGSSFEVEVSASLVRDEAGSGVCMMASFSDVTERNEAQRALQQLNSELEARVAERTASLVAAKAEAERANQVKSEFLAAMSHEMRTPLNAVLGFGQLLESEPDLSPRAQSYVKQVLSGGRHVLALVGDVLDLARVEAGCVELHPKPVPLPTMLENCRQLLAPLAREYGTLWPPAVVPEDATAWADETALRQVLLNLLSNAVKYGGRGCTVSLSVSRPTAQRVAIAVADNGPGIPLQHMPRLFQPFDRLGAEHADVPGTGLGLAITQRLVQHMQGSIRVRSEPDEGCCFTVELPATGSL